MKNLVSGPGSPGAVAGEVGRVSFRRILLPSDFSPGSDSALRFVTPLARAWGAEITVLHVIPTAMPPGAGAASLTNPALLRANLHHDVSASLVRRTAPAIEAAVPTRLAIREGKPVEEILGLAGALSADLVVVGATGLGRLERAVLGSVAESLLGRARCPVLVVPTLARPPAEGRLATVLLATDFSPHAALAQDYALSIAEQSRASLVLLHVVEGGGRKAEEQAREAERDLRSVASAARETGLAAEVIVTAGDASSEVLRVARERGADLIVMGVQGARALHSLFFGSTAHRVTRGAACAVLGVRET